MSTSQEEGLWKAGFGEIGATLKALQDAGLTQAGLKALRADKELAQAVVALITERQVAPIEKLEAIMALIKPTEEQILAWHDANNQGNFGIPQAEFKAIPTPPELTDQDRRDGFVGVCLFYGFGGEGEQSDMVLSGKIAWEYAASQRATWKMDEVKFDNTRFFKPREGAHPRPSGFYWKKVQLSHAYQDQPTQEARKQLYETDWGMGPEGIQFLAITHTQYVEQMNGNFIILFDLLDYEVAPCGDSNFFYAPYMFFVRDLGKGKLGLRADAVSDLKCSSNSLR